MLFSYVFLTNKHTNTEYTLSYTAYFFGGGGGGGGSFVHPGGVSVSSVTGAYASSYLSITPQ